MGRNNYAIETGILGVSMTEVTKVQEFRVENGITLSGVV